MLLEAIVSAISTAALLDIATFQQLRRLAPVLDGVLNAGEVDYADQAVTSGSPRNALLAVVRCLQPRASSGNSASVSIVDGE